ncbi:MAG TPA: S9 family peptidase [Chthoniobacterales bacterium]|jgi:dipeptidyl aminopeptidase/acylaminoacyl peptidase|nr:S9 family peptidase [Chthoniobacterales bacterium]
MHWKILTLSFLLAASALGQTPVSSPGPAAKRPFTFADMMKLKRVSSFDLSPDGKWVVFDAVDVDLEANTRISHLWIVAAAGGEARRLNQTANPEERPRFSPHGKRLIWTSKATDPTQIWICNFTPETGGLDGQPQQLTSISTGADGGIWSPDGKNIVFLSSVYPEAKDDAENKRRDEELEKSKVKAKIFTKLLYRHWTSYTGFKRSHLFVVNVEAGVAPAGEQQNAGETPASTPRDLTPGDHDVPPFNLGGQDMYAVSPDGQELAYTSNIDEVEATSTNNEIFLVPIAGGTPKKISTSPGNDNTPVYSPDGNHLAWRSMARAGFEADKESLIIFQRQTGQNRNATINFDRSVGSLAWTPDSKGLYFTAEERGETPIWSLPLDGKQPKQVARLHADDLAFSNDGTSLFFSHVSISAPAEIARLDLSAKSGGANLTPVPVTRMNEALLAQIDMQPLESFTFPGANNEPVEGFILRPPGFDSTKKYPLKFLIHGGPQGAWGNSWTYRWNAQLFAATGNYVVVMINFHGSTGYGQKFTDSISGDWGGKPYEDLIKGLDYVEKTYPFIDKNREAAMGASYGGYMANWVLGHTDRFKCIVSHDGVFNTESAYGTTEELWFTEWEFKGPPWTNRELYRKWSPHLFADKFKTPTLVIHGQLDFRLDVSEGFQLFTTLQRLKVPSKMLYFPDEGHWVLKPQNSQLWYKTVNEWVDQWTGR